MVGKFNNNGDGIFATEHKLGGGGSMLNRQYEDANTLILLILVVTIV